MQKKASIVEIYKAPDRRTKARRGQADRRTTARAAPDRCGGRGGRKHDEKQTRSAVSVVPV